MQPLLLPRTASCSWRRVGRPSHASQTTQEIGAASINGCQTLSPMPCLASARLARLSVRCPLPSAVHEQTTLMPARPPRICGAAAIGIRKQRYEHRAAKPPWLACLPYHAWTVVLLCPNYSLIPGPIPVHCEVCRLSLAKVLISQSSSCKLRCVVGAPNQMVATQLASLGPAAFGESHICLCPDARDILSIRPDYVVPS